jgi:hypothetical protein
VIQSLRRSHSRIWTVLPVILAILFAAALVVRRSALPKNPGVLWEMYK